MFEQTKKKRKKKGPGGTGDKDADLANTVEVPDVSSTLQKVDKAIEKCKEKKRRGGCCFGDCDD